MNVQTKFIHLLLRLVNAKKIASKAILHPKRATKFSYPRSFQKYQPKHILIENRDVVTYSCSDKKDGEHLIFLHGGAYTVEVQTGHWWLAEQLLKKMDCKLSFINYPLAPECTYNQTYQMLLATYNHLIEEYPNERFYLLGDSAGGGLCLSFAQTLRDLQITPKPEKIVLLSPWLDLSMSNPVIKTLEKRDLLLSVETLKTSARWFAGKLDLKSPTLSPLYGNMNDLNSIAVFVGTHEIFLPDCRVLKQKIEASNTTVVYKEYDEMQHDFAVFPTKERHALLQDLTDYFLDK